MLAARDVAWRDVGHAMLAARDVAWREARQRQGNAVRRHRGHDGRRGTMTSVIGTLSTQPAISRLDLLADPVAAVLQTWPSQPGHEQAQPGHEQAQTRPSWADDVRVAAIDPDLADTAAFCAAYQVGLAVSANCVVIAGKREGIIRYAACVVLATTRADVNGIARRALNVRKASFAPMDSAVKETGMQYGGITPIGLPGDWPILVDAAVVATPYVIIGSGIRASKIVIPGKALANLPSAQVIEGLGKSA